MGNATFRANAANAGLAANYFIANPANLGGANVQTNQGKTRFNSLQLELRRRLSHGLQFDTSYVFGKSYDTVFTGFGNSLAWREPTGNTGDTVHQFKANVVYDLPFGRGRRWGAGVNPVVDRVIGGWELGINSRLQSGYLVDLGDVRLVGMSRRDVQNMFKLRFDAAGHEVYMLPQDVIDNTILAFSVSATSPTGYADVAPTGRYFAPANGPDCIETSPGSGGGIQGPVGNCGTGNLVVHGPMFQQHDIRVSKRTTVIGHTNLEIAAELLNAFNHPNFLPVAGTSSNNPSQLSNYQVTSLQGQDTSRTIQLEFRFNW